MKGRVWTLEIERERLVPSSTNPRKEFPEEMLQERGESLKALGQQTALVVRPKGQWVSKRIRELLSLRDHKKLKGSDEVVLLGLELLSGQETVAISQGDIELAIDAAIRSLEMEFEIVAGECRWRASAKKYADLKTLRCDVRILSDGEAVDVQWAENLQRKDLNALEVAEGLLRLKESGWTVEMMCARLKKSRTQVYEGLKIARAEGPVREALKEGKISPSVAALVVQVPDKKEQAKMVALTNSVCFDYTGKPHSVKEVAEQIERTYLRGIDWDLKKPFAHANAVMAMCADCPKNTRNMTEENPDLAKGPARCFMGAECWRERVELVNLAKAKEAQEKAAKLAKELGTRVMTEQESRRAGWDSDYLPSDQAVDGFDKKGEIISVPVEKLVKKAKGVKPCGIAIVADEAVPVYKREDLVAAGVELPLEEPPAKDKKVEAEREAMRKQEELRRAFVLAAREAAYEVVKEMKDAAVVLRALVMRELYQGGSVEVDGDKIEEDADLSGFDEVKCARVLGESMVTDAYWDVTRGDEGAPYWAKAFGITADAVLKRMEGQAKA